MPTRPRSNWPTSSTAASRPTRMPRRACGTSSAPARAEIVPEITDDLLAQSVKDEELLRIMRELGPEVLHGRAAHGQGQDARRLTFITAESGRRYDAADLAVAEDLADRAAIAIENAQLTGNCGRPTAARTSSWRRWPTNSATRWPRSATPCRSCGWRAGDRDGRPRPGTMMERQVQQMVRLVDDLLDVCRITRGKIELRKERVELAAVVHSAVETSRPLIEQAGHD